MDDNAYAIKLHTTWNQLLFEVCKIEGDLAL